MTLYPKNPSIQAVLEPLCFQCEHFASKTGICFSCEDKSQYRKGRNCKSNSIKKEEK